MNKKTLILFITTISTANFAMDSTTIQEITTTKNPSIVKFLHNNRLAFGNEYGCNLTDIQTNTKIIQLCDKVNSTIVTHPNKKKIAIISRNEIAKNDELSVYDLEKNKEFWHYTSGDVTRLMAAFSSIDDSIFLCQNNMLRDNDNNKYELSRGVDTHSIICLMCHPTKKEFVCLQNVFCFHSQFLIAQPDHHPIITSTYTLPHDPLYTPPTPWLVDGILYSPDGNYIACRNADSKDRICLYNHATKEVIYLPLCHNITFHPNNLMIAMISYNSTIDYFNIKTKQIITSTPVPLEPSCSNLTHTLDFSPDGNKLAIIITGRCYVADVPFDALYEAGAKDKFIFAYCVLQHYCQKKGNILPQEVIQLFMHTMLKLYAFSNKEFT